MGYVKSFIVLAQLEELFQFLFYICWQCHNDGNICCLIAQYNLKTKIRFFLSLLRIYSSGVATLKEMNLSSWDKFEDGYIEDDINTIAKRDSYFF